MAGVAKAQAEWLQLREGEWRVQRAGRHLTAALKGLHWMLWRVECRTQGRSWEPAGIGGGRGLSWVPAGGSVQGLGPALHPPA